MASVGDTPLVVLGLGLRTSFGATAVASVTGLGLMTPIRRLRRLGGADDHGAMVSAVRGLRDDVRGRARTAQLAASAMREACAGWSHGALPVLVAVPEAEAQARTPEDASWLVAVAHEVGISLDRMRSSVLPLGRAGVLLALTRAAELLRGRDAPAAVLIGGAHTCLEARPERPDADPSTFLMAEGHHTRGEAAGFMLVARERPADARRLAFEATIEGVAIRASAQDVALRRERLAAERAGATEPSSPLDDVREAPEAEAWRAAFDDLGLRKSGDAARLLADVRHATPATEHFLDGARAVLLDVDPAELAWGEQLGDIGAATPFLLVASALLGPALESGTAGRVALAVGASEPSGGVVLLGVRATAPAPPAEQRLPAPSPARAVADTARRELWRHRSALMQFARWRANEPPPEPPPPRDIFAPFLEGEDREAEVEAAPPPLPGEDVAPSSAALDRTLRALADSDLWDALHLQRLDAAATAARRLVEALPEPPGGLLPIGDAAMATADGLHAIRRATLDKAAAISTLRGEGRTHRPEPRPTGPAAWGPIGAMRVQGSLPDAVASTSAGSLESALERGPEDVASRDRAEAELLAAEAAEEIVHLRFAREPGPARPGATTSHGFGVVDLATLEAIDLRIGRLLSRIEALGAAALSSPEPEARPDVVDALQRVLPPSGIYPSRAFARAFILGSVEDDEAAFLATQDLCDGSDLCLGAIADGLALASGSDVTRELSARCTSEREPRRLAAALDALAMRRGARMGICAPLLAHRDPGVRTSACFALGWVEPVSIAAQLLMTAATTEREAAPLAAALESLIRHGSQIGLHRARLSLDEREHSPERFIRLVGLAGGPADVDRIVACIGLTEALVALGWLGSTLGIDSLVKVLREESPGSEGSASISPRAFAAAAALQRITGGVPSGGGTLIRASLQTSDPARLETRPDRWEAFVSEQRLDERKKLRWGHPWRPESSLDELDAAGARREDRVDAQLELAARSPKACAILRDPMDRASLQRAAIAVVRTP